MRDKNWNSNIVSAVKIRPSGRERRCPIHRLVTRHRRLGRVLAKVIVATVLVIESHADEPFFNGAQYPIEDCPERVVTGDFNGDGITDIVTNGFESDVLSVLFGQRDGSFAKQIHHSIGSWPDSMTAAELNGDGITDLITTDPVLVLLAAGDGTFSNPINPGIGSGAFIVEDFNNDGTNDLAHTNFSGSVSVWFGLGDGTFNIDGNYAVGNNPSSIAAGDFDGDRVIDLVTSGDNPKGVSVLLGIGDGTFAMQQSFAVDFAPDRVFTGHFNHDGLLDIVTVNRNSRTFSVQLGNGDGTFNKTITHDASDDDHFSFKIGVVGDFDDDGIADLATSHFHDDEVSIWRGRGDGTFEDRLTIPTGAHPAHLASGDFNNDGVCDLVSAIGWTTGTATVHLSPVTRGYSVGSNPRCTITGDFNVDGVTDLVTAQPESVSLLIGKGDGSFLPAKPFAAGGSAYSAASANLDGVGGPDLVLANHTSNSVSVLLGNGNGSFAPPVTYVVGGGPRSVTTDDFNGDGMIDLATANYDSNKVAVLIGVGDGTFESPTTYVVGERPRAIISADFNGDGAIDLAVANSDSNDVSVLLGNGNGTFSNPIILDAGWYPRGIIHEDFNRDGILDLAVANCETASILLGNGDGSFAEQIQLHIGDTPTDIASGDLNGDGIPDLLTSEEYYRNCSMYLGLGDGTFGPKRDFAGGVSLTTGDFNADGATDVATAVNYVDKVFVLLNQANNLRVGDVNQDGHVNLLDVAPFVSLIMTGEYLEEADINGDGVVNLLDVEPFVDLLSGS